MVQDAISFIVKGLVEHPEKVKVDDKSEEHNYHLLITADEKDVGKIIGKDGKTIRALRTIMNLFGPEGKEKSLDIAQ